MRTIIYGTDALFKFGVEPLLRQGKITHKQYAECLRRAVALPQEERRTEIILG